MATLHLLSLLLALGSARIFTDAASISVQHLLAQQQSFEPFTATTLPSSVADVLTATPEGRQCADISSIPIAGLNLTADELAILPQLCWHADQVASFPSPVASVEADSRGIPPGVICKHTQWCAVAGPSLSPSPLFRAQHSCGILYSWHFVFQPPQMHSACHTGIAHVNGSRLPCVVLLMSISILSLQHCSCWQAVSHCHMTQPLLFHITAQVREGRWGVRRDLRARFRVRGTMAAARAAHAAAPLAAGARLLWHRVASAETCPL